MSRGDNSPGLSRLAGVMKGIASDQVPTEKILDLGKIQSDKSLITDSFGVAIPRSDYLVLSQLKKSEKSQEGIKTGDRVLVAWVNNDAIVLGKIIPASDAL